MGSKNSFPVTKSAPRIEAGMQQLAAAAEHSAALLCVHTHAGQQPYYSISYLAIL